MSVKREIVAQATDPRPTDDRVASRRELPPHITAYVAHLIREWEAKSPKRPLAQLAAKLKVSRSTLIGVRDGWRGVGATLESSVARVFHGGSVDALREAAARHRDETSGATSPVTTATAAPKSAPQERPTSELRQAIAFLRDTYPPAFLAYAEAKAPDAIDDGRTRVEWLDWIRSLYGPWSRRQGESKAPARAKVPAKRKSRTGS